MPYGGNFSAVGGLSFFGGNDFGGGGKTKIWRQFFGSIGFTVTGDYEFLGNVLHGIGKCVFSR